MRGKPIRVLAAVAAIVLAGFAVAALSRSDDPPRVVATDMNHGNVRFTKGQEQRILNALEATTESTAPDALAAEGRRVFRDPALFENGESCQTCHAEGSASSRTGLMVHDKRAPARAPMPPTDFDGPRDPPALWGLAKTPPYFWNGDVPSLRQAIERPVFGHMKRFVTGDCRPVKGVGAVPDNPERPASCDADAGELAAQLVAYVKTLDPPTTGFDQGRLSEAALRGEKIFQGKGGCIECHGGPNFTDNLVHDTGVPQVKFNSPYRPGNPELTSDDKGAPAPPPDPGCTGTPLPAGCDAAPPTGSAFINTPQMRDLKDTAPYMHNGALKTLKEVVDFYNKESTLAPLNLTSNEVDDLVAYLESL
jgi:cytochrome c peroxidase